MNDKYLVSIIIPVYNVENYVKNCIDSCLNQTYDNIEIIAIDDGSTDSSSQILDELEQINKKLRVIHKENSGVSSTRNVGINAAKGEYILFVDSDDYLAKDAVEYMMKVIIDTSSDFAILKNCFTSINQRQTDDTITQITNEDAIFLLLGLSMEIGCWNKIYSKKMLNENNIRFNEKLFYGEGLKFILNVAQKAKRVGLGTKCVYYYRKNNLTSATSRFNYKKFENGEKALLIIREEIITESKKNKAIWMYHYIMFAQNAIISCINNKKNISDYKKIYKDWNKKFNEYLGRIIFSKYIDVKSKIKLLIFRFSPNFFANIRNKKFQKRVERSV